MRIYYLSVIYLIGRKGKSSKAQTLLSPDKITRNRRFRVVIYLIGRKGRSSEAKTLLSPDNITRKHSFRDYDYRNKCRFGVLEIPPVPSPVRSSTIFNIYMITRNSKLILINLTYLSGHLLKST